jgi:hypothetical protein
MATDPMKTEMALSVRIIIYAAFSALRCSQASLSVTRSSTLHSRICDASGHGWAHAQCTLNLDELSAD